MLDPVAGIRVGALASRPASFDAAGLAVHLAAVLGLDAVGPDDDLFALGGTSLAAARLAARLAAAGADVTVASILDAPTPSRLAAHLAPAPWLPRASPQPAPGSSP